MQNCLEELLDFGLSSPTKLRPFDDVDPASSLRSHSGNGKVELVVAKRKKKKNKKGFSTKVKDLFL